MNTQDRATPLPEEQCTKEEIYYLSETKFHLITKRLSRAKPELETIVRRPLHQPRGKDNRDKMRYTGEQLQFIFTTDYDLH